MLHKRSTTSRERQELGGGANIQRTPMRMLSQLQAQRAGGMPTRSSAPDLAHHAGERDHILGQPMPPGLFPHAAANDALQVFEGRAFA